MDKKTMDELGIIAIPEEHNVEYGLVDILGGEINDTLKSMVEFWAESGRDAEGPSRDLKHPREWVNINNAADDYVRLLQKEVDSKHVTVTDDTVYTDGTVSYEDLCEELHDDGDIITEACEMNVDDGTVMTKDGETIPPEGWDALVATWDPDRIEDLDLEEAVKQARYDVMTDEGMTRSEIVFEYEYN